MKELLVAFILALACTHVKSSRDLTSRDEEEPSAAVMAKESATIKTPMLDVLHSIPDLGWIAGYNPGIHDTDLNTFKRTLGAYRRPPAHALQVKTFGHRNYQLPASFDAREKWGANCPTLFEIRDQGHCGSCWAFGAVEVLSDRFCIHGNESVSLSTNDLLSCCGALCGDGCDGGWPYKAWQYFQRNGVVSEKCQPYFDHEGCKHPGCSPVRPTPKCRRHCSDGENWRRTKHYAKNVYAVGPEVEEIMAEVYENGPVEVDFVVYEDFTYYQSGVYRHVAGGIAGGHAVKLVGWGTTEDGVDYWLISNSWNKSWGEDGYFRIVRGTNECDIESDVVAGLPDLTRGFTRASGAVNVQ